MLDDVELTNGTPHVYRTMQLSSGEMQRGPLMYSVPDVKTFLADYGRCVALIHCSHIIRNNGGH